MGGKPSAFPHKKMERLAGIIDTRLQQSRCCQPISGQERSACFKVTRLVRWAVGRIDPNYESVSTHFYRPTNGSTGVGTRDQTRAPARREFQLNHFECFRVVEKTRDHHCLPLPLHRSTLSICPSGCATMVSSDVNYMMSDAASRAATAPRRQFPSSSGARPRAPPSESNVGAPSDDEGEGFADDHVPGRSRRGPGDIPPVEDKVGLTVQENFEDFIEK
jgi:hypothetical protein